MNKPTILFIFAGAKYDLDHEFEVFLNHLSKNFSGYVITESFAAVNKNYGDFKLVSFKHWFKFPFINFFKYIISIFVYFLKLKFDRKVNIDLVVTYDPLKTGLLGLIAAWVYNAKFSPEVNGDYTTEVNYREINNKFMQKFKRLVFLTIERFVLKRSDGIKILYKSQIDFFKTDLQGKYIRVLPAYVDLSIFKNIEEKKEILFAGFPFYLKGVDLLIDAFKRVSDKYPEWTLKILGWYPNKQELEDKIGGHEKIYHHPPVYHKDMPEHIGRCGIFVLPSRSEAMGRVLLEAMAAGKARIGSDAGGIPTIINHGEDGLLFAAGNINSLTECLDKLLSDVSLREKLGRNGRDRAMREFSNDRFFSDFKSFYMKIIQ